MGLYFRFPHIITLLFHPYNQFEALYYPNLIWLLTCHCQNTYLLWKNTPQMFKWLSVPTVLMKHTFFFNRRRVPKNSASLKTILQEFLTFLVHFDAINAFSNIFYTLTSNLQDAVHKLNVWSKKLSNFSLQTFNQSECSDITSGYRKWLKTRTRENIEQTFGFIKCL